MPVVQDEFSPAFSGAFDPPRPGNEFSAAFSGAFDPVVRLRNEFSAAFSTAFDRSAATPTSYTFTISGDGLDGVGNALEVPEPRYVVNVIAPDGSTMTLNTISTADDGRVVCTWGFSQPGTHYFVIVDRYGDEVSDRLPVVVSL